jgi:2-polyprenyl-3-methyl-5-hydroxy-6-metoxy-1,4-benzoquinol methylase
MIEKIKKLFFKESLGNYQVKRKIDYNWRLIKEKILNSNNLLDIGCDVGDYCFKSAELGLITLGIDTNYRNIEFANRQSFKATHKYQQCLFLHQNVDIEFIKKLPEFENILCLSVYHHFVRNFGEDESISIVQKLFEKSKKNFFFQISSKDNKYKNKLNYKLNQSEEETDIYINGIFKNFSNSKIIKLGRKPENPPVEDWRILYLIQKN